MASAACSSSSLHSLMSLPPLHGQSRKLRNARATSRRSSSGSRRVWYGADRYKWSFPCSDEVPSHKLSGKCSGVLARLPKALEVNKRESRHVTHACNEMLGALDCLAPELLEKSSCKLGEAGPQMVGLADYLANHNPLPEVESILASIFAWQLITSGAKEDPIYPPFDPLGLAENPVESIPKNNNYGYLAMLSMFGFFVNSTFAHNAFALTGNFVPETVPLESILTNTSFVLFGLVTLIHWGKPIYGKNKTVSDLGQKGMLIAVICTTAFLLNRWFSSGHLPLSNLYESSFFLSWCLSLIHLIFEKQSKSDWIGVITAPSAMLTQAFATLGIPKEMQKSTALVPALQSNWLMMHVSMMIFSYATLMFGSLLAIAYLFVNSKQKEESSIRDNIQDNMSLASVDSRRLKLRQQLDQWSYRSITLGFPLLTTGILSGAVWANEAWGSYWSWDPKETWALITWLIFAIYLHTRMNKGWQGEKPAQVASFGFFIIWICYLGVNLLGKGLHSYGWLQS